jgi:hypothetical protein
MVPSETSTATVAVFLSAKSAFAAEVWPLSGIRMAEAPMTAKM